MRCLKFQRVCQNDPGYHQIIPERDVCNQVPLKKHARIQSIMSARKWASKWHSTNCNSLPISVRLSGALPCVQQQVAKRGTCNHVVAHMPLKKLAACRLCFITQGHLQSWSGLRQLDLDPIFTICHSTYRLQLA